MKPLVTLLLLVALVSAPCVDAADQAAGRQLQADIAWARSAAPPALAAAAAVAAFSDDGQVRELAKGKNDWTCIVHDPCTPTGAPLCLDRNGLEWMTTAMSGRDPDPDKIGYSYMLKGGSVWSATDPSAMKLPEGQTDFVHLPPHIMILNARVANASGFPSGQANPDTHQPFVLYGGTPFAILIIPVD